ncbi:hypothetical protein HMPREF0980_01691 [Dorea sp. D27]|nr:hypothetical protein HMPREF0980_01691 [Dorea sp. D27]
MAMTPEMMFDQMGILLDTDKAQDYSGGLLYQKDAQEKDEEKQKRSIQIEGKEDMAEYGFFFNIIEP